jgi:hypothetical protein
MHAGISVLAALPLPRHEESALSDLATSHRGLSRPVLPIEGVRVHASTIRTGTLARFRAFKHAQPSGAPRRRSRPGGDRVVAGSLLLRSQYNKLLARGWLSPDAWLSGMSRVRQKPVFRARFPGQAIIVPTCTVT